MIKYSLRMFLFLSVCVMTFTQCSKEEDPQEFKFSSDKEMVSSIVDALILPEERNFTIQVYNFEQLSAVFTENSTIENLEKLKAQWMLVAKSWARCYAFNIGEVKDKRFFVYFNSFPVNASAIESKCSSSDEITKESVLNMGVDTKGIFGLEYLLFNDDASKVVESFSSNIKRKQLLTFIAKELVTDALNQKQAWELYAPKLKNSTVATGELKNPLNLIFNGLTNVIHYAWETKIGKPAGIGKSRVLQKDKIQALYSQISLELIKENINMTKNIYFGNTKNVIGIAEKVLFINKNEKLNTTILNQYNKIESVIASIDMPLQDALTSKKNDVKSLYNLLKELESKSLSTDVRSTLSLITTGNDGDGD